MTAVVVFAHGSSVETANDAVRAVSARVSAAGGFEMSATAFLEMGQPDLPSAVADLIGKGARRVIVLPYFLTTGIHLKRDLPRIVEEILVIHKDVRIEIAPPLDGHPGLEAVLLDRAKEALSR